jgi:hypothetical protein
VNSHCRSVVDSARPPAQRFRLARSNCFFAEQLNGEEFLAEEILIEEALVRDARAGLTPSDMVERKLNVVLKRHAARAAQN